MVLFYDSIAQHTGILFIPLFVFCQLSIGDEIVFGVYNTTLPVYTVAFLIHIVAQYVHGLANRHRYVGAFSKEFDQKSNDFIRVGKLIIFHVISLLSFEFKVFVNQAWGLQHKM